MLELYTSGAIGDDMDQLYVGRFMFDTLYVVFMEMIFQGLVGGIIIDAFMGLKEEDSVRDEDKKNKCYICAMNKPDVINLFYFRCKSLEQPSTNILKSIVCGIIFSTSTVLT